MRDSVAQKFFLQNNRWGKIPPHSTPLHVSEARGVASDGRLPVPVAAAAVTALLVRSSAPGLPLRPLPAFGFPAQLVFGSLDAQLESRDDWVCGPARDGRRGQKEVLLATGSATAHIFFAINPCGRTHFLTSLSNLFTTPSEGPRTPFYLSKSCDVPSKCGYGFCLLRLTFPSASSPWVHA